MRKRTIRRLPWGGKRREHTKGSEAIPVARRPTTKTPAARGTTDAVAADHDRGPVPTTSKTGTAQSKRRRWPWVAATDP